MNKKVLTLCAGVLLVSGSAVFTMNALNVGNEKAQSTYVAAISTRAAGDVVSYTLQTATYSNELTPNWALETATEEGQSYLKVGEFYLGTDLTMTSNKAEAKAFTVANGVIEGLYITSEGLTTEAGENSPAGLFGLNGKVATTTEGSFLLGAVAYEDAEMVSLTAESSIFQMTGATENRAVVTTLTNDDITNIATAPIEATITIEAVAGDNYVMKTEAGYLKDNSGTLAFVETSTDASLVSVDGSNDNKVKVGSTNYLKVDDGNLTLTGTAGESTVYLQENDINNATLSVATSLKAGSYCLINSNDGSDLAESDANITFAAATEAVTGLEATLGAGDYSTDFSALETEGVKFSTTSTGQLKSGEKFVVYDAASNGPVLAEATGNDYILQSDGSFKFGSIVLAVGETTLYAYNNANTLYTDATQEGSNLVLAAETMADAAVSDLTETSPVITATPTTQTATAPGADIPGMGEEVYVDENGEIALVAGVASTQDIPAPFTIEVAEGEKLPEGLAGSWTLDGGKLVNLAAQKAGKEAIYLGADNKLVEEADALTGISYDANGLTIGGTAYATLKTTGEALALEENKTGEELMSSVGNGNIVEITDGTNKTVRYQIVVGSISDGLYNYSFIEVDNNGKPTTDPATYLEIEGEKNFTGHAYDGTFSLQASNGKYVSLSGTSLELVDEQTSLSLIAYEIPADAQPYNVAQLLNDFGTKTSFGVTLKHKYTDEDGDDATKDITIGNVFADAELVPYKYDETKKELVALTGDKNDDEEAILLKSGDRFIVLETTEDSEWTSINDDLKDGGYKFTTLGEKAMLEMMDGDGKLNDKTYAPYFTFNYDNNTNENGEGKAVYNIEVKNFDKSHRNYVSSFEVKSGAQKGVYLTVTADKAYWVAAELGANNLVKAKSDHSPLNYQYVNIQFANHESIKESNGKLLDGRVLGADLNTADADEFLFNKPEGQWIVNVTAAGIKKDLGEDGVADMKDATGFTFINRESGREYAVTAMYYLGDDKYAVTSSQKFAASPANRDTLIIKKADIELKNNTIQRDGYADLKAIDIQDEQFNLLVASAEEDYYVGENHSSKSHFLGLSHDESAAVNWRIVPLTAKTAYDKDGILMTVSDSIYIRNYPQYFGTGDKLFSYSDTIAIVSYALQNTSNGEYLTYEDPQTTTTLSMICDPDFKSFKTTKDVTNAYRFVLKEKANGLYNILSVNGDVEYEKEDENGNRYWAKGDKAYTLGTNKLYGATTLTKQGAIEVEGRYTQINSNDLFKVQQVAAPEYRELAQGDTIRIFREENDFDTMYEDGSFLNLGNSAQLTDMNPALYVDTAYVNRGTNNRYQYLLAVNVTRVDEELCNHVPATHPKIHPDTTYGRFLVNLIDSAVIEYANGAVHNNKFINDTEADETFVKLGFVWGYRTEDHLYLTEGQDFTKVKDVIDLSTNDFNIAKFAFRYANPTNADDQSFKIQTRYIDYATAIKDYDEAIEESHNNGYLKTINGVVVVVPGYARGEEFNLAAETRVPTANEEISAENSAVSVVATDGAVTIKGAEGKNVVIATILGKVVANETINSDNETIAVPAGIAVVSVDGESFKVVVK